MASQAWLAADINGLTPAIDLRRSKELFALSGKNYYFDSLGPKSGFGNRLLSDFEIATPQYYQGARVSLRGGDRVFHFHAEAILEWDEMEGEHTIRYGTADTTIDPQRWTFGYLNDYIYFCHPAIGLIRLNIYSNVCAPCDGPGVPQTPIAMCIDNGRVVVIDNEVLYWSKQSDGNDFTPTLAGAGFQKIGERVSGDPITIHSYGKGTLTFTTGGIMRSEFTGDSEVYRHRNINTEYRPINSFCSAQLDDDTVIILDERGLFQSRGESPQPMTPVFNEFLIRYLQKNDLKIGQNVRIEWDNLRRLLYVSTSTSFASAIYEKTFVLYPPLDKWGTFDEPHYGIVPICIPNGERGDDYFGFLGEDNLLRFWIETGSRQTAEGELVALDAELRIGLIRLDGLSESNDQLSEVLQVMIGNIVSGPADIVSEDFNLVPPDTSDEDYNSGTGQEDLGFERSNYVNHKIRLIGTVDGSTYFDSAEPQMTLFTPAARYYACSCVGVWHILELKADEVGESFHVQAFELTATYAGKLS